MQLGDHERCGLFEVGGIAEDAAQLLDHGVQISAGIVADDLADASAAPFLRSRCGMARFHNALRLSSLARYCASPAYLRRLRRRSPSQ